MDHNLINNISMIIFFGWCGCIIRRAHKPTIIYYHSNIINEV